MPTFKLSASPAIRTIRDLLSSTEMSLMEDLVDPVRAEARNVDEVAARVLEFGASVAKARPGVSFLVFVTPLRGQRKPRGFDAAKKAGAIHNEAWLHTVVERPAAHLDGPGVRMWGSRFTPFQLDGRDPMRPDATPDEFTSHADGSIGLYGWLRAVNARVQQRTEARRNLFDISAGVDLRAHYQARVHPFDEAAELLEMSSSTMLAAA